MEGAPVRYGNARLSKSMKRINLIPPEFATGKKAWVETGLQKQVVFLGIMFVIGLSVHFGLNQWKMLELKKEVHAMNNALTQAETSSQSLKRTKEGLVAQLERVQKRSVSLSEKKNNLLELEGAQFKWSEALAEFHKVIPGKVWVDELHLEPGKSFVRGGTYGNQMVSEFIDGINESPFFRNASFTRTEAGVLNELPVVNFELTFDLALKRK